MPEQQVTPGWFTALGVLMIVVGVVAVGTPLLATLAMNVFIGWMLAFIGAAEVVHAFSSRGWGGFLWQLLIGALTTLAGLFMVFYPLRGAITLTLVIAVWMIVAGILRIVLGFGLRPAPGSGAVIVSGVLALLLGVIVYSGWPASGAWVIGTIVGINLIFSGWGVMACAAAARQAR